MLQTKWIQIAPLGAVRSGFILFVSMKKSSLKCTWICAEGIFRTNNSGGIRVKWLYVLCLTECPPCYSLVQERVNIHRGKLRELNNLILNIGNDPDAFNDTKFTEQMGNVNDSINILLSEARGASSMWNIFLLFLVSTMSHPLWFHSVCLIRLHLWSGHLFCLFLLLYVPSQQLWSLRDGQFT